MYAKYIILVYVSLLASFLNYFLAPIVVLFANDAGWLPRWLWWFQTPTDPLDKDYRDKRYPGTQTGFKRWFSRVAWLYRNSMYGLCIDVLGAKCLASDTLITVGDRRVSNRPIFNGLIRHTLYRDGKAIYFQRYYVRQWASNRCLRVNLGWKLWGFEGKDRSCQLTFSPNPLMGLST